MDWWLVVNHKVEPFFRMIVIAPSVPSSFPNLTELPQPVLSCSPYAVRAGEGRGLVTFFRMFQPLKNLPRLTKHCKVFKALKVV